MAEELLDCVSLRVPAEVMETFEAALSSVCRAVSFYHDEDADEWDLQGVKERGEYEEDLAAALMI
ncbi:MAG: 50S ribosomal protein L11 methyltransferase, partial [Rhodospirillales bacterium]|nr:50S ribosomal protein L11 methyltransferase [Rhodospirillales bacterium]